MEPGTEIPADFDPDFPGMVAIRTGQQGDMDYVARQLKPGHKQRKKIWQRKELADKLGDDFYTNSPEVWKTIIGSLEPDEIQEIKDQLIDELPGSKADNQRMLDYMLGGMKLKQKDIAAQAGYGGDQKGETGGLTQQSDKLINLLLFALATHLNVAGEYLDEFWKNLRSENTDSRNARKRLRPLIFGEICAELNVNLNALARGLKGVYPAYNRETVNKKAADKVVMMLFVREYDHMSADERGVVQEIFQKYENKNRVRKMISGLNPDQNTEFQDLIIRMRDDGDLPDEDRVRLMQLDIMRKNPGVGEDMAHAQAEHKYAEKTQNGEAEFLEYTTQLARTFLDGLSNHMTKDNIYVPNRDVQGN